VNDVRITLQRPRLEQRFRRRTMDVARLEQARQAAHREVTRPRIM
jgi:hypothetical protein